MCEDTTCIFTDLWWYARNSKWSQHFCHLSPIATNHILHLIAHILAAAYHSHLQSMCKISQIFLCNKTNQMHLFHKFILSWNSTCFGQFACPSSGVYSGWSCSKAVYKLVWHILLLSLQWINSWRWTGELSETCRVSWQNEFVKLVYLVDLITKKCVTMHGYMNVEYRRYITKYIR
jgi:hypothetical protein